MSDTDGEPGRGTPDADLSLDERAELPDYGPRSPPCASSRRQRHSGTASAGASPVASVLIVIGCLLAPMSVLGVWTANQVSDTSRYVENIEPLIHDPTVQNALTDKITVAITSHLNVVGYTNQAADALTSRGLTRVGSLLKTFGPSIASSVAGFIHGQVHKIVTSDRFARPPGSG